MVTIITLYPKGYKKAKREKKEKWKKLLKSIGTDMCHLAFCVGEAGTLRNISFSLKFAHATLPAAVLISFRNSKGVPEKFFL